MFGPQTPTKNVLALFAAFALIFAACTTTVVMAEETNPGVNDSVPPLNELTVPFAEPVDPASQQTAPAPVQPEGVGTATQDPAIPGSSTPPPTAQGPVTQGPMQNPQPLGQAILSDMPNSTIEPLPPQNHPLGNMLLDSNPLDSAPQGSTLAPESRLVPVPEKVTTARPQPEAASFAGITPGMATAEQVEKAWGAPIEVVRQDGAAVHRYKIEPFERIEAVFSGDKVMSIIVRLETALPADKLAKELRIDDVTPVFVSGEMGEILGQAFPERGVLFAFSQKMPATDGPANPVTEIVLEPLGPDPFVLRAESRLDSHFDENLRDLELAIKYAPNHARALWLYSRVLCAVGRTDEAVGAIRKAIQVDGKNAQYRITYAQILDQLGDRAGAIQQAKAAVERGEKFPHIKARALCLLGDLTNAADTPDMAKALEYHTFAIKTIEPLLSNRHPAIRKIAKEVAIDAHLGAASDIAWGNWSNKGKSVDRWTALAAAFAEELIANEGGTDEYRFRVATRSLSSYVGVNGELDPTEWAEESLRVGQQLIQQAVDPVVRQQLEWETGMAAFNAVQVYQARNDQDSSLKYGELAAGHLAAGRLETEPEQGYLLGRLHFRLGTIHALTKNDHTAAVACYEKSLKLFAKPIPNQSVAEIGRQGEAYVSMGVSFWEVGRKGEAVTMTKQGVELVKQAVEAGAMPKSALIVPYENLANMQRYEGQTNAATATQQLADQIKETTVAPKIANPLNGKPLR